jgi:hypothetical protein
MSATTITGRHLVGRQLRIRDRVVERRRRGAGRGLAALDAVDRYLDVDRRGQNVQHRRHAFERERHGGDRSGFSGDRLLRLAIAHLLGGDRVLADGNRQRAAGRHRRAVDLDLRGRRRDRQVHARDRGLDRLFEQSDDARRDLTGQRVAGVDLEQRDEVGLGAVLIAETELRPRPHLVRGRQQLAARRVVHRLGFESGDGQVERAQRSVVVERIEQSLGFRELRIDRLRDRETGRQQGGRQDECEGDLSYRHHWYT